MSESSDHKAAKSAKESLIAGQSGTALYIDGQSVMPGEHRVVGLKVGSLPSDTRIYINAFTYRAIEPGPVLLILAGMHGDEINGVEIVRQAIKDGLFNKITKGSVIAIPLLNVYGFINYSRDLPDGKDVNRSFPGNSRGSLASRMAFILSRKILPAADFIIDFHTGGASRYNYPQIRYTRTSEESLALARDFGVPFIIQKPVIKRSLRQIAGKGGKTIIVYEGGEALRLEGLATSQGYTGIRNSLISLGMLEGKISKPQAPTVLIKKTTWMRASTAGLFRWTVESGMPVVRGQLLGEITDPYNSRSKPVLARRSGFIIGHNNAPVVNVGEALFSIGYEFEEL